MVAHETEVPNGKCCQSGLAGARRHLMKEKASKFISVFAEGPGRPSICKRPGKSSACGCVHQT